MWEKKFFFFSQLNVVRNKKNLEFRANLEAIIFLSVETIIKSREKVFLKIKTKNSSV